VADEKEMHEAELKLLWERRLTGGTGMNDRSLKMVADRIHRRGHESCDDLIAEQKARIQDLERMLTQAIGTIRFYEPEDLIATDFENILKEKD